MNKVLIGITSKNRVAILPKSIESALSQHYPNKEVAVFDDHSTDGTSALAELFKNITWHFSAEEKGYLYARNVFIQTTDAKYYCSLDDDSWFLENEQLSNAIGYMEANPKVAVLSFKILSEDLRNEIKRGDAIIETNNFIGCGHMLRVEAVKSVGSYAVNPGFYGGEEKDLSIRLINSGYSIMRFPAVEVWHDKTMVSRDALRQHRSGVCNDFAFMWRRTPLIYLVPAVLQRVFVHLIFPVKYKNTSLYRPMLSGVSDFVKGLFKGKIRREAVSIASFRKYLSFNK